MHDFHHPVMDHVHQTVAHHDNQPAAHNTQNQVADHADVHHTHHHHTHDEVVELKGPNPYDEHDNYPDIEFVSSTPSTLSDTYSLQQVYTHPYPSPTNSKRPSKFSKYGHYTKNGKPTTAPKPEPPMFPGRWGVFSPHYGSYPQASTLLQRTCTVLNAFSRDIKLRKEAHHLGHQGLSEQDIREVVHRIDVIARHSRRQLNRLLEETEREWRRDRIKGLSKIIEDRVLDKYVAREVRWYKFRCFIWGRTFSRRADKDEIKLGDAIYDARKACVEALILATYM